MNAEPKSTLRESLKAAFPAVEVPDTLRRRVSTLASAAASTHTQNKQRRRRIGLRLVGVAATVIAVLAFLLPPKLTAVQALQRMTASLRDVHSAHTIEWKVLPDGTQVKSGEIWYQAGDWRVEDIEPHSQRVQICRNGTRWTYDTNANTVTQDKAAFPDGYNTISGFSIAALLHDTSVVGNQSHVTLLGTTTERGRPAHIIMFYSQWLYDKREPTWRSRITVDDATDLPIRSETQRRKPVETEWKTDSIREEHYNQPLAAGIFTPDFPKTARAIDAVAEREYWRRRLGEGVASQKVGHTSYEIHYTSPDLSPETTLVRSPANVVIRDFQVNAEGDVFLLFTANTAAGRDIPFGTAELTDDFGTKYLNPSGQNSGIGAQAFIPTCVDLASTGMKVSGFLFQNEQVEGIRWVPLQKQALWKPRHFRLTLHLAHIGADEQPGTAVFDLPVLRPEAEAVPKYMPYMARPLTGDAGAQNQEASETRAYYLYHAAYELPQALAAYQELIALRSERQRKLGSSSAFNADEWFEVYHILSDMGRLEEAKAALLSAKKDDDTYRFSPITHDGIQIEMKKLHMTP